MFHDYSATRFLGCNVQLVELARRQMDVETPANL